MTTESISSRLLDIGLNVSTGIGCGLDVGKRGNASRFALQRVIHTKLEE
jgi:hypothetical protein